MTSRRSPDVLPLLYRWVDAAAARSYMRHDAMIGRTRHWLPKQLTGLDKIYRKRGLSFALKPGQWMDISKPIGFVIGESSLDGGVVRIDGHETYLFSGGMDLLKSGIAPIEDMAERRQQVIECGQNDPDEGFVLGDIRGLAARVHMILVRDDPSWDLMAPWCERKSIPLERHHAL